MTVAVDPTTPQGDDSGDDSGDRWVSFTPRDTVVVRDGRSFDAGTTGGERDVRTVAPWPSTVAGALTTAFTGAEPEEVRGPVLARRTRVGGPWSPRFPVPADLHAPEGEGPWGRGVRVVRVVPGPAAPDPAGVVAVSDLADPPETLLLPPVGVDAVVPLSGLVRSDDLGRYLADGIATGDTVDVEESPLVPEVRVGLARRGRVAADGYLYAMTHLRPRDDWAFLAQFRDSEATRGTRPDGPVPLGGRSRLADCAEAAGTQWPAAPADFPGGFVLLYVATAAIWSGGWRPPLPPDVHLVGAAVPDPVPVATASARRARQRAGSPAPGPRGLRSTAALRWAVPAGAVYLVRVEARSEAEAAERAKRWAGSVHGRAFGPSADAAQDGVDRLRTAGFGVVLVGRWGTNGNRGIAVPDTRREGSDR